MATGKVDYNSDLIRSKWMTSKLVSDRAHSFWNPYTGKTPTSIIYQVTDGGCSAGKTVIFDFSGKLTGAGFKGAESGCAIGETKRKFSDKLSVDMYSFYVDNGSKFNACLIGDLSLPQHSDSRSLLSDLWTRQKDQAIFDVLQGAAFSEDGGILGAGGLCGPTHIYDLGCGFEWNDLMYIENAAKKGTNLVKAVNGMVSSIPAVKRMPLEGYRLQNGEPIYLAVIDNVMSTKLRANPKYQTIKINADVRGDGNALISGHLGKESNVLYVEAPVFFGATKGKGTFNIITDTEVQFSGLRRYAHGPDNVQVWEGQAAFDAIEAKSIAEKTDIAKLTDPAAIKKAKADRDYMVYSRGLLLGAGAAMEGFGKMPIYEFEWTKFKKQSESMLEVIFNVKKTELTLEMGKDYDGKITDIDFGVICLDMEN